MDYDIDPATLRQWDEEFEAAARRPLELRMKYAFIKTYKPVMDDAPFRAFETMAEYRKWCEENFAGLVGFGRPSSKPRRSARTLFS